MILHFDSSVNPQPSSPAPLKPKKPKPTLKEKLRTSGRGETLSKKNSARSESEVLLLLLVSNAQLLPAPVPCGFASRFQGFVRSPFRIAHRCSVMLRPRHFPSPSQSPCPMWYKRQRAAQTDYLASHTVSSRQLW